MFERTYYDQETTEKYCKEIEEILNSNLEKFLKEEEHWEVSIIEVAKEFRKAICRASQLYDGLRPGKLRDKTLELMRKCEKIYLEAGFN